MRHPYSADCALNALNGHFKRVNRQYRDIAGFLIKQQQLYNTISQCHGQQPIS